MHRQIMLRSNKRNKNRKTDQTHWLLFVFRVNLKCQNCKELICIQRTRYNQISRLVMSRIMWFNNVCSLVFEVSICYNLVERFFLIFRRKFCYFYFSLFIYLLLFFALKVRMFIYVSKSDNSKVKIFINCLMTMNTIFSSKPAL